MSREPIFGPNAKSMFAQIVVGVMVVLEMLYFVVTWTRPDVSSSS
jgi:hypothetical protein